MPRPGLLHFLYVLISAGLGIFGALPLRGAVVPARPADAFVDSIGVNIHSTHYLGGGGTAYNNWPAVINALSDIGIRNVRDVPFDPDRLNALTAATGARVLALCEYQDFTQGYRSLNQSKLSDVLNYAKSINGLTWLEGPNEYDDQYDPNWQTSLRTWQTNMYAMAKADAMLAAKPIIAPGIRGTAQVNDLYPSIDLGNMHSYPGFNPPDNQFDLNVEIARRLCRDKLIVATETGYADRPRGLPIVDFTRASVKFMPRLLLDYFNFGIDHTFIYELLDQDLDPNNTSAEDHVGLFDYNFNYKPIGIAVKNLITLLRDPGPDFTPSSLDYTISGGDATLRQTLLQKRDGTYYLALWQNANGWDSVNNTDVDIPPMPVTLTLASPMAIVRTYLPDGSVAPTGTYSNVSQLSLNVPDEVLLVELSPTPEPSSVLSVVGAALYLAGRRRGF